MTSSPPSSHLAAAVPPECPPPRDGNWRQGLRSLWHLSRHLTARADDNHAAPRRPSVDWDVSVPSGRRSSPGKVYHRIKPHVPPLVRAPVNSFEFQPCGRTPQVDGLTLSLRHRNLRPGGWPSSFTAWTTRVSNPVRSPRFRASASITASRRASAIGVLRDIYAFHRYTTHSRRGHRIPEPQSGRQTPG